MAEAASRGVIDFTNVKEGGGSFSKKRQPEGDYRGKITKVADAPAKKDNTPQWLFTIEVNGQTYPYYCKHEENQFWKIRNILVASGITVPKKKVNVDPNKLVGKNIAVTLEDDEYDGKAQSNVAAVFPLSELSDDNVPDEDETADLDDDDDDADDAPPPPKKKKAPEPEPEEEEDEDEDSDPLASLDRTELKAIIASEGLAFSVKKSMSDDDIRAGITTARAATTANDEDEDEDEDEAPTPPPAKKKKPAPKPAADDDDLEEIDIDDA